MSHIKVSEQGSITTLLFDRLDRKNAITADMYAALADALNQAKDSTTTRVVVIRGHEEVFTAGNDLGDFLNNPPHGDNSPVFRFLQAISTFPKPIIAAVSGAAVGVGTTLLMHCDVVYASDSAKFSMPFSSLGLCPEAASSLLFPQLVGLQQASEKLLFGEAFDAQEAHAIGLVNKVLPAAQLFEFAQQRAQALAQRPLSSLMITKQLIRAPQAATIAATMQTEGGHFRRMLTEPAAREAFMAFMQKRSPDFSKV
jgi:enoyl-CoA hydratase/carnithine racemase